MNDWPYIYIKFLLSINKPFYKESGWSLGLAKTFLNTKMMNSYFIELGKYLVSIVVAGFIVKAPLAATSKTSTFYLITGATFVLVNV